MDNQDRKFFRPKFTAVTIMIILGVVVAVAVYQAQMSGFLPILSSPTKKSSQKLVQTQTIVQEENAIISVVEKSANSVVAIGIVRQVVDPLDPFADSQKKDATIGTGFVVEKTGVIVTNKHVVNKSGEYSVVTNDGKKYDVRKIYRDPALDLAILKIDSTDIPALEMGDSSKLRVGQTVIAIGNALGKYTNTVTTGIVSGLGRKVITGDLYSDSLESMDNLIQTDAAINPGNSGGPILNSAGLVIGVSVSTTEGAQNIGFAVPINAVRDVVDEFLQNGAIIRPYIGIKYRYISKEISDLNNVTPGAYIQEIAKGSPAEQAGLELGDIITKINNIEINSENKLGEVVSKAGIGSTLELTLWRKGKLGKLSTKITDTPQSP